MSSTITMIDGTEITDSREPKKLAADAERYRALHQFLRVDDKNISHVNQDHILYIEEIE